MPGGHATIPAMTSRRDQRQTHVRPRSPSTGRPAPVKSRPRDPGPIRLSGHRPIQRSGGLPIIFRIALALAVVALGAGILFVGANGIGAVVSALGANVSGFISNVTSTPSPKPSIATVSDAPSLRQPGEPYTSQSTVDLEVSAPPGLAGDPDHRIRVYLTLPDQAPSAHPGIGHRRRGQDGHPGRAREGHQRLHRHDRRSGRRVGSVRRRALRLRQVTAQDHDHLAQGQRDRQRQGADDQGQDPGPDHVAGPQRHERLIDRGHSGAGWDVQPEPVDQHRGQQDPADRHGSGGQRKRGDPHGPAWHRQADRVADRHRVTRSGARRCPRP